MDEKIAHLLFKDESMIRDYQTLQHTWFLKGKQSSRQQANIVVLNDHSRPAYGDHQHAIANDFIINVDSDNHISSHP